MHKKQSFNYFVFIFFLLVLPLLVNQSVDAETDDTEATSSGYTPNWDAFDEITTIGIAPFGAAQPVVAAAPNGSTVMIAYDRKRSSGGNSDPYYRVSTNNGETWGGQQFIHASGVNSASVAIDYDSGSQAHAVWVENDDQISYARQAGSGWTSQKKVNQYTPLLVASPQLFATGSSTIDLIWVQNNLLGSDPNPGISDIYHARSINDGSSWTGKGSIFATARDASNPALFVQGNTIHVVWAEQHATIAQRKNIFYSVSTNGGTTWSSGIDIDGESSDGRSPSITITGDILHVAFTEITDGTNPNQQFVHHVSCSLTTTCSNANNWSSDGGISGQVLGANNSAPYSVLSGATSFQNCTLIYFHGTIDGETTESEQLFGTSSCNGSIWGNRETLTANDVQTLRPNLDTQNNWWVYLTFEQVDGSGKSQIWLLRNQPALYLPVILK